MTSELSKESRTLLDQYLVLPLPGESVACPYYNNNHQRVRMGIRAQIGKGAPEEIVDEVCAYAIKEKVNLSKMTSDEKKKFLIAHNLGIDCSGLAYHILNTEARARGKGDLSNFLYFPYTPSLLAKIGRVLRRRYAENSDTKTLAHASNSRPVELSEARAGDFFVRLNKKMDSRDHILIVTKVDGDQIWIAQSESRPTDGRYGHGVREEPYTNSENLPLHRLNLFT